MRQFTEKETCYKIGTSIYVSDFSGFFVKEKTTSWDYRFYELIKESIRCRQNSMEPLIVVSEPYLPEKDAQFPDEYYIDVKFSRSPEVYCILNSGPKTTGIWTDFWKYTEWIADCEECKEFGY